MTYPFRHTTKTERSNNHSILSEGKLALGIAIGSITSIVALSLFPGLGLQHAQGSPTGLAFDILPILIALTSLLIAYNALHEQRKVRQAGTDPVILIHLGSREDARILSTLEVRNVGAGAALNVKVTLVSDLSEFVPGRIITDFTRLYPIATIPQDHSVSFNFGVGQNLLAEPLIPPVEFQVEYSDIEDNSYVSKQYVDVRELRGQRADETVETRTAKALERVSKSLEDCQSGHKPLNVITKSAREHHEEKAALAKNLVQEMESWAQEGRS